MSSARTVTIMSSASETSSSGSCSGSPTSNGSGFQRIPSESSISQKDGQIIDNKTNKPWERSQSALDLKNNRFRSASVDYIEGPVGGKLSEHSKVYWDLSQAEDANLAGGKFKISLQTIHQKEEMTSSGSPSVSIQARVVRRMASETSLVNSNHTEYELTMPGSCSPSEETTPVLLSPSVEKQKKHHFHFSFNQGKPPNLKVTLANAVPVMQNNIKMLRGTTVTEQKNALGDMLSMIEEAWATPMIGRDLAYGLCDVLRDDGGLDILIENCNNSTYDVQLGSAKVLEQSMTVSNREVVAQKGLEVVVRLADAAKEDIELTTVTTGILESLFKHSEDTCAKVIKYGGLDSILYFCRNLDTMTLRNCAEALANLAMYGGQDNQQEMISHKAAEWLFPLAFSNDDSIRYFAFLAITALSANKEIESAVAKSGTLELVKPFILSHDPDEFAKNDRAHIHGQSKDWLRRLVPILQSKREEAQSLAAFHFAMEAGIKAEQGKQEIFHEIGAVEPLRQVASGTNKLASKFAARALRTIGESVPYKLSTQVPLWSVTDVTHWLQQTGFEDYVEAFTECNVDGDLLLTLSEENLRDDLCMTNGITRKRFFRELKQLKITSDYEAVDPSHLDDFLGSIGPDYSQYSYQMLRSGVERRIMRHLSDEHLRYDCYIDNGIHRMRIMEAGKSLPTLASTPGTYDPDSQVEKPIDVFISYRRSNGSQLASLLKVHLQLRGYTVFLDIEKLRAGKFDDNLLNSVRNARNFILVLTENCLDRCIHDDDHKDWVHREVVAAIEGGCNIIPIMDAFQWPDPETLPKDMRPICFFNGIRWIHDYQDACVDKLEKFITGELTPLPSNRPCLSKGSSFGETHLAAIKRGSSLD